jgi:hypothetical protein
MTDTPESHPATWESSYMVLGGLRNGCPVASERAGPAAPVGGPQKTERSHVMKAKLILAVTAASVLCSVSAYASCVSTANLDATRQIPRISLPKLPSLGAQHQGNAASAIVGTWLVTYVVEGEPFGQAYIQWHSDGTEWENINLPVEGGNICMGSWKAVDAKHVYRNHYGWLYTNGQVSGYFNETETNAVKKNGTYSGTNEQKGYDLDGNLLFDVTGTSSATLIAP